MVRVLAVGNMYPPHHLGGYELMWRSATHELRRRGLETRVLASDYARADPDAAIEEDPDVYRELRWYWRDHRFPRLPLRTRREIEIANLATLERHLRDFRPDVVAWWAMGGMSMSLVERVARGPLPAAGFVVDDWLIYGPKVDGWQRTWRVAPLRAFAERRFGIPTVLDLAAAAEWTFVSETALRHARENGLHPRGAQVAYGGVDSGLFPRAPERQWEWELLYVGRIDRRKGVHTAIRALSDLPEARLTVIGSGDGQHLRELESIAEREGLTDRLRFERRRRAELAAAYAAADAVLFPAIWEEPWGLVPLEAMSVGRPVVATGAGGSGEYLRDGSNCLLYAPRDDPSALARAVNRLAADEELRLRIRNEGFETAANHTEESFNQRVVDAVKAAARRRGSR